MQAINLPIKNTFPPYCPQEKSYKKLMKSSLSKQRCEISRTKGKVHRDLLTR